MDGSAPTPREIGRAIVSSAGTQEGRALLERWCSPEMIDHRPDCQSGDFAGMIASVEGLAERVEAIQTNVEETVAEGELVLVRWTLRGVIRPDHPGGGRPIAFAGMTLFRFADGRIVERWVSRNEVDAEYTPMLKPKLILG